MDNDDYLFARAYKRDGNEKDTQLMLQIGRDYVAYIESKLKYFEQQRWAMSKGKKGASSKMIHQPRIIL